MPTLHTHEAPHPTERTNTPIVVPAPKSGAAYGL
jgi:hypothetical protein